MSDVRISGFSYARNADSLYYPIRESICSILPICSEFVIALGKGDATDRTREIIASIGDPRIRIIDTEWREKEDLGGDHLFREQTDIALSACTGDWCFHIQCDEVIHENDLSIIDGACKKYKSDFRVEGFLLKWLHFWGDYDHLQVSHRFFNREIRIVRNRIGVSSFGDSQSFRKNDEKLKCIELSARVFHYAMVRPPLLMRQKQLAASRIYHGKETAVTDGPAEYDYGPLNRHPVFEGSHPGIMREWISRMDWKDRLQYYGKMKTVHHHDKLKYRIVTWIERHILGGRKLGGFRNYRLLKP